MRRESWQWNLAALWLAETLTMVAFSFVIPFFPLYLQTLGIRGTVEAAQWAGLITAATAVSMAIVQPIWGSMADRWGRRPMVIRSMLGASLSVFLMGLVVSPEQLLLVRLLQGALSGTVAAANALVATSTPKHRTGFALGVMQMGMFLGGSVGPLLGGLISDNWGFRPAFYTAAALMLIGALIVIAFVREDFARPVSTELRTGVMRESRYLMGIALFPVLFGVVFMIQFGGVIVSPILSLFIAELSRGENAASAAGMVIAATGAASAASALGLGRISDRVGHAVILPICLVGAAVTYFPQVFVTEVWQLMLLRMLLGGFLGGLMPAANALVADIVPQEKRGAAFGLMATASALANAIGPLMAAAIVTFWSLRAIFLATTVLYVVTYAWTALGFRRRQPTAPRAELAVPAESPETVYD